MEYSQKLKDPRWQKRRLEVLEKAKWKCQLCGTTTKTLNVHHLYYHGEPWDVPSNALECLCEECHELRPHLNSYIAERIQFVPTRQLKEMANFFKALEMMGVAWRGQAGRHFGDFFEEGLKRMMEAAEQSQKENPPDLEEQNDLKNDKPKSEKTRSKKKARLSLTT